MCIAVYKEKGAAPVKKRIFKNCWEANDDGAGFAWWDFPNKTWQVRKGFMTFKNFWKAYNKHQFGEDDIVICHFRVGTSGDKNGPTCTHPFPVSKEEAHLKSTTYRASQIILHNGVVGSGSGQLSDTMVAIRDHASVLWQYAHDERVLDLMLELLKYDTNRWLITDKKDVYLYGDWDDGKEDDMPGVWFSNQGYKDVYRNWQDEYTRARVNGKWQYTKKTTFQRNQQQANEPVIIYSCYTVDKFRNDLGNWCWKTYIASCTIAQSCNGQRSLNEQGTPAVQEPSIAASLPKVTGLVDKQGNILWDEGYQSRDDLALCPNCNHNDYLRDVEPDTVPLTTLDASDLLECGKCGATFNHNTGVLLYWNEDIKAEYTSALKEAIG